MVHFDINTKGGGGHATKSTNTAGPAKKISNVTVVEGLRTAGSGNGSAASGVRRGSQLPSDARQRLEEMASRSRAATASPRTSSSVAGMGGSTPNLTSGPPKRGQEASDWMRAATAVANNNLGVKSSSSGLHHSSSSVSRRDSSSGNGGNVRDLNLKNSGGVGVSNPAVSPPAPTATEVASNPLMQLSEQSKLPTMSTGGSLSARHSVDNTGDPSKKVRPRSFWANWWRF